MNLPCSQESLKWISGAIPGNLNKIMNKKLRNNKGVYMAKTKKKSEKEVEVAEVFAAPAAIVGECIPKSEKLSDIVIDIKSKVAGILQGHREIDLAKEDIAIALNKALSLILFIESTEAELAKKKR